jgi:hypothetical protein
MEVQALRVDNAIIDTLFSSLSAVVDSIRPGLSETMRPELMAIIEFSFYYCTSAANKVFIITFPPLIKK